MLVSSAVELTRHETPNPRSNAFLESFLIHARCLHDFLWRERLKGRPLDAFASDFCEQGVWEARCDEASSALTEITSKRIGRELAHLTYHRQDLSSNAKQWPYGDVCFEITHGLHSLVSLARPGTLDLETEEALMDPQTHFSGVGPASVSLGEHYESDSVQGLEIGS